MSIALAGNKASVNRSAKKFIKVAWFTSFNIQGFSFCEMWVATLLTFFISIM